MQNSQNNTLGLPAQGSQNPSTLARAGAVPLRVVVRNVGPNLVLIAHDIGTLTATPAVAGTFRLGPTMEDVFILAPQEGLFATAIGAGGVVSVAISGAMPIGVFP